LDPAAHLPVLLDVGRVYHTSKNQVIVDRKPEVLLLFWPAVSPLPRLLHLDSKSIVRGPQGVLHHAVKHFRSLSAGHSSRLWTGGDSSQLFSQLQLQLPAQTKPSLLQGWKAERGEV